MHQLTPYIWIAGGIQLAIAGANLILPGKLGYRRNLARVDPIIRQVFVVHASYIAFLLVAFAGLCFFFPAELAGATALGNALSFGLAVFWAPRLIVQWVYYDPKVRRENFFAHLAFSAAIVYLIVIFTVAGLERLR